MIRPEFVRCIQSTHANFVGISWCGRSVAHEWTFVSVDHSAFSGKHGDRLVACRECVAAVIAGLRNGHDDPDYS